MIRVAVGLLIKADKLLVAKRPLSKPYSGYWEFPGGKIELNETSEEALTRELYEELGITVRAATLLFEHHHTYPDKTVLLEVWQVNDYTGEPFPKENQEDLRFVTAGELGGLRLLEGNLQILNKLAELL